MHYKDNQQVPNRTNNNHILKAVFVAASMLTVNACGSSNSDGETTPPDTSINTVADTAGTTAVSSLNGEWRFCSAISSTGDSSELRTIIFNGESFSDFTELHQNGDCSGNVSLGAANRILEKKGTYELVGEFITESGLTAQKINFFIEHPTDPTLNTIEYSIIHNLDTNQLLIGSGNSVSPDSRPQDLELEAPFLAQATSSMTDQNALTQEACGDITIARMDWGSAELIAEIDNIILSKGYGCSTEFIAGSTLPTFTSMNEKGEPDLAPELWVNNFREQLDTAVAEGGMIIGADILSDGGEEGWWIPKYLAEANPDIKTAADAFARPDLFPSPNNRSIGAVHNCPSGWSCETSTANLFTAHEGETKGFELIAPGSVAGLENSIARAFENQDGWLGYYWSPTAILGRFEMVKLDMGEHDKEHWDTCTAVLDCENPRVNGWATNEVVSVVTNDFARKAGVAMDYISTRSWKNATVNTVLAWMADNQATGEQGALHFIENNEDIWSAWVSQEAMEKIKASL